MSIRSNPCLGLIGAGNISATHLRAAQSISGVEVVAVYSPRIEKARKLAAAANATAYDDLGAFLGHPHLEVVAIGSPSGVHAQQALAAIERGIHAVVEKPLDISTARIDSVIEAAERRGVQIGVFFQDRLKPGVLRAKRLVEDQRLGKPVLASGRVKWHRPADYYASSQWRGTLALDGGGAMMNQAIHTVDLMQWLFGPVASVSARVATRLHAIEAEDTAVAVFTFESGALGVLEAATSVFPGYARRLELTGAEGTLILEQDTLTAVDLRQGTDAAAEGGAASASATSAVVADATPHARVIEDFIDAIRTGRAPACDAREGRKSVAIVEAIYRSAQTGRAEPVR